MPDGRHKAEGGKQQAERVRLTVLALLDALFKVWNGALTLRDVKNEDRSGYVYENKGEQTQCLVTKPAFCTKMRQLRDNRKQFSGLFGRKCGNAVTK
jgi:hypothetical protein